MSFQRITVIGSAVPRKSSASDSCIRRSPSSSSARSSSSCDFVDECAGDLFSYAVTEVRPSARDQADVVLRATVKLDEAVQRLEGFKDSRAQLIELRALEDEGDRLMHDSLADLFRGTSDPMTVIRWKDIHEGLEEAVDACENADDVLEAILVKNR